MVWGTGRSWETLYISDHLCGESASVDLPHRVSAYVADEIRWDATCGIMEFVVDMGVEGRNGA